MVRPIRFVQLPCHVSAMSEAELRVYLAGSPRLVILRSLLVNEFQHLVESGASPPTRTLRGLWYQLVKPVLSRLGMLGEDDSPDSVDAMMAECLADLLPMEGLLPEGGDGAPFGYPTLGIVDGSCRFRPARSLGEPLATAQLVGARYPGVILFLEKVTLWPVLENLAAFYGVSAISGGDQHGFAALEELMARIAAVEGSSDAEVVILSVTDYDPDGYEMAEALGAQAEVLAPRFGLGPVETIRLGVEPEQVDHLAMNSYRLRESVATAARTLRWLNQTGGVDGLSRGIELDTLPVERIRGLFVDALAGIVPENELVADAVRAAVEQMAFEHLRPQVEQVLQAARAAVADVVPEPQESVHALAAQGDSFPDHQRLLSAETLDAISRLVARAVAEEEEKE